MSDLFWPGDERAGAHFSAEDLVGALLTVEEEWLGAGIEVQIDATALALAAEPGGNPVIPLVAMLRDQADAVHRGLTSQDVLDTALMRMARAAVASLRRDLHLVVRKLTELAVENRETPMVARTLTQQAIPTTFGFRVATWLTAVLDADDDLARLALPDQLGGAAGTRAAIVELGREVPTGVPRWHTTRAPVTRLGDALAGCTDACARIANDVLVMARTEVGELAEGEGGASSTMPNKSNPILAILIRRAALTTPQLAATLHLAAALQVDDRADGAWHAEWATLRDLVRRTLVTASQTRDLVDHLVVRADRMGANLDSAGDSLLAERNAMARATGNPPAATYFGDALSHIDEVVARAARTLEAAR